MKPSVGVALVLGIVPEMSMALSRNMKKAQVDDDDSDEELPRRRKKEVNPHDARWLVGEGGEQGYYDHTGDWVTTGWHDAEGYHQHWMDPDARPNHWKTRPPRAQARYLSSLVLGPKRGRKASIPFHFRSFRTSHVATMGPWKGSQHVR